MAALHLLTDCPSCRVEGGVLELVDPHGRVEVSVEGLCRLCGYRTEYGLVHHEGRAFTTVDEVTTAIAAWAAADGEPDVLLFTQVNMGGLTPAEVAARVLRKERVATSFDVIAFLFPQAASGSGFQPDDRKPELRAVNEVAPLPLASVPPEHAAPTWTPEHVARALVSVMVADGVVRPSEKKLLARLLAEWGAPAMPEADYRVWRPQELGTPPDAAKLLDAMRAMCLVDREADGTEVRILQEYARAWDLRLDGQALEKPGAARALVNAVVRLFVA